MLSVMLAAGLAAGTGSCGCAATFEDVTHAVEENYAGYVVKLPDDSSRAAYRKFRDLLKADAASAADVARCRELLDAYLAFFADDHLFVTNVSAAPDGAPETATVAAAAAAASAPEIPNLAARWTPEKVKFRLRREGNLDPIEGLWRDDEGEFAIVYDEAIPRGEYVAFRFSYQYGTRPGEIIAFIRPQGDGSYQVLYRENDGWRRAPATLVRGTGVLTFANRGWQRTTEASAQIDVDNSFFAEEKKPEVERQLVAADPLAPHFESLGDGIYYLRLASFMPEYAEPLKAIIAKHGETLSKARGLIIDVRGNGGGDAIYYPLADWFLTGPITISQPNAILAAEWNIRYLEYLREASGKNGAWLDAPLERMRANRGRIVPFRDGFVEGPDNAQPGPENIVVLQDRGVGSAAEAFLLHARQSPKVVTMGESSKGNIDYQQVSMRTLGCGAFRVDFGWPLYMRTRTLPADSLDDSGIPPDVRLSPVHGDWLEYAERWLRSGEM
ncbi:MAG TPA: S41 family peptidase [Gammaproteobacteria bacterium]